MIKNSEHRVGYKHTALGWLPDDWRIQELRDLTEKIGSGITPTGGAKVYKNEGRHFIRSQNVGWGCLLLDDIAYINEELHHTFKSTELKENDVLLNITGASIGRSAIADNRVAGGNVNQHVCIIRTFQNQLLPRFLNNFLLSTTGQNIIDSYQAGGNRQGLNFEHIKSFKIPIPTIPEQKAIAKVLSTWDSAIDNVRLLIDNLELRKKWLMQQLLTGKKRLPGFTGEWKEVRLLDVFERVTRKNTEKNTNVVTISAQRGFIRQEDFFNKVVASDITDNYFLVHKGEFCYNKSYCNGYAWGATKRLKDFEKAVVTTLYICFGLKNSNSVSGDFFEYYFDANLLDEGLTQIAHEGGRAHGLLNVTPNDFFNLKITIPGYEEQKQIARVLSTINKEIQISKSRLDSLKEQKKGLMQVLLTGKKRMKWDRE